MGAPLRNSNMAAGNQWKRFFSLLNLRTFALLSTFWLLRTRKHKANRYFRSRNMLPRNNADATHCGKSCVLLSKQSGLWSWRLASLFKNDFYLMKNSKFLSLVFSDVTWKPNSLTFWIGQQPRFFRRFFTYSVICHYSKYIRLALTNKKKLCQIKKKITPFIWSRQTSLRINETRVVIYEHSCGAMYRARESKIKLDLFYLMFIKLFCHVLFWP